MRAGRILDTQVCCQQALELDPGHADTLHLLGLLSLQAEQYDAAIEWSARAIRSDPKPEYLLTLGTTLTRQGRHEEAFKTVEKAIQLKPEDAELWTSLGRTLVNLKRPADALVSFQHALKLNPHHWDAACQSGILFYQSRRLQEALVAFDLCDRVRPNHFSTVYMRALILHEQG
jgi:tetratricopeptide (TPR) repeat protein